MHCKIEISMVGAAFADEPATELARILVELANQIECGETEKVLRDFNGNRVGKFEVYS